jgi:RNA polymerase sigma-70 factor, ECF subfamily
VQSDAQIVAEVCAGDVEIYATLVRRYERLVRATILQKMGDRHLADDLVQDSFLIAFESLATLRDAERFGPWLLGIARNGAARSFRGASRRETTVSDMDALVGSGDGGLGDESSDLLELVERLPEHERILVGLKYFAGHTASEIATITSRPIGTITKQLSRAHERLGAWLKQEANR